MENILLIQIGGFVLCFVLLFYFMAKYRTALEHDADEEYPEQDFTVMTVSKPSFSSRAAALGALAHSSTLDVADLKERVKELYYQLQEDKFSQDKNNADLQKQLSRLEQRLTTFEQEYVNKLQPTLLSLIEELEGMKVASPADTAQTPEKQDK